MQLGTLYKLTKSLTKTGFQTTDMPVKDQQGNVISKDDDKLRCWKEHFERVLNRDDSETAEAIILPSPELLDIDTDPPNVEEVKRAMKALKDGKTPGIDQIYAEMLKVDIQITVTLLAHILRDIWESEESEEAPLSWKTGLGSLSTDVFEPRTSTGSRDFSVLMRISPFSFKSQAFNAKMRAL